MQRAFTDLWSEMMSKASSGDSFVFAMSSLASFCFGSSS